MRNYWLRILLGALAVYVVGMILVTMVRHGKHKVESVIASSDPLMIPLPFVPFELGGQRLGKVEGLVLNRSAPKKVSSVEVKVKLDDSLVAQGLSGCRLAANVESDSSGDVNLKPGSRAKGEFFYCASADSALVEFGTVHLQPGDLAIPLLVPEAIAEQLQSGNWDGAAHVDSADVLAAHAESLAANAEKLRDSFADVRGAQAESLARYARRLVDSLRAAGVLRADSIRSAVRGMADSLPRQ